MTDDLASRAAELMRMTSAMNSNLNAVQRQHKERVEELAGRQDAKGIFLHLMEQVRIFEGKLSPEHELGIHLANFGLPAQMHVRWIGYQNPNLIEFEGLLDGRRLTKLIQHIGQLNFMLVAIEPFGTDEPYRMGFDMTNR
jgi:Family of unknown function (DUF6173)